jgi:hypothetical protein
MRLLLKVSMLLMVRLMPVGAIAAVVASLLGVCLRCTMVAP